MLEVVLNDRLGKKVRVKCNDDDTIGDLKKLVAAQTGTRAEKIRIQKWNSSAVLQGVVEDEAASSLLKSLAWLKRYNEASITTDN
ncbi:hypothetical protein NC651_019614 [Populus alba x Populus x berolinensis]|nr:hypothetical protein NC651_019614 [Populus alba x Populus x berolinensis]